MIQKIPAAHRYTARHGWLTATHLFSFANYFDPANVHFGTLRVFNDDYIAPHSGFGDHAHSDMEIVTIVLEGALTHRDSMGNVGTMYAGDVQRMSAGTGVVHSEVNEGGVQVHSYQIWILPDQVGTQPSYEQKNMEELFFRNKLVPVASGRTLPGALHMHTDATIYIAELDAGSGISVECAPERGVFIYPREGKLNINNITLEAFDQARIHGEPQIDIKAEAETKLVLIEVPVS